MLFSHRYLYSVLKIPNPSRKGRLRYINNLASGTAEFTDDLPRLGNISGRLMTEKAEKALSDQQSLLEKS